jgi:hypothetical protein
VPDRKEVLTYVGECCFHPCVWELPEMYIAEKCEEQIGLHQHDWENFIDVMTIVKQGKVKVADIKSTLLL